MRQNIEPAAAAPLAAPQFSPLAVCTADVAEAAAERADRAAARAERMANHAVLAACKVTAAAASHSPKVKAPTSPVTGSRSTAASPDAALDRRAAPPPPPRRGRRHGGLEGEGKLMQSTRKKQKVKAIRKFIAQQNQTAYVQL